MQPPIGPLEPLPDEQLTSSSSQADNQALLENLVALLRELQLLQPDLSQQELGQSASPAILDESADCKDVQNPAPLLDMDSPLKKKTTPSPSSPHSSVAAIQSHPLSEPSLGSRLPEGAPPEPPAQVFTSSTMPESQELFALQQSVTQLETKLTQLEQQIYQPTELINPLLPLITELLQLKTNESRETVLQTVIPVIDEVIRSRAQQDQHKMAAALSDLLPIALTQEIQNHPTAVATAIAPEIAIALQEQIRLDPDAIATTLGPEMGKAIKTQIVVERNAMVDALYPVIGSTISKYMVELVQTINEKIETAFSFQGLARKIRARLQGVSEAELIFRESIGFAVQAVFLIHKASGLVIRGTQVTPEFHLEADMLAGMLTAIRSFVNDCVAQPDLNSELHEIDYDGSKIILEVAGYCYLAAIVRGSPSPEFMHQLRETLGQIVLKYDRLVQTFDGDATKVPAGVQALLEKLVVSDLAAAPNRSRPPIALLILFLSLALPLAYLAYRSHVARQIESQAAIALDAAPELSVYRITPKVRGKTLTLTGRVPNSTLRARAGQVAVAVAPELQLDNQLIAVKVPPDPERISQEVQRLTRSLNQQPGMAITARYQTGTVTITGIVPNLESIEQVTQTFRSIPGVDTVINTVQKHDLQAVRIYFEPNSIQLTSSDTLAKITLIQHLLTQHPQVQLRIIGYTDSTGEAARNRKLGLERALAVQQALVARHVNLKQLHISGTDSRPWDVTADQPLWLGRCVRFEVFASP